MIFRQKSINDSSSITIDSYRLLSILLISNNRQIVFFCDFIFYRLTTSGARLVERTRRAVHLYTKLFKSPETKWTPRDKGLLLQGLKSMCATSSPGQYLQQNPRQISLHVVVVVFYTISRQSQAQSLRVSSCSPPLYRATITTVFNSFFIAPFSRSADLKLIPQQVITSSYEGPAPKHGIRNPEMEMESRKRKWNTESNINDRRLKNFSLQNLVQSKENLSQFSWQFP